MVIKNGDIKEMYLDGERMSVVKYDKGLLLKVTGPYNRENIVYRYFKDSSHEKDPKFSYIEIKANKKQIRFYRIANKLDKI